MRKSVPVAILLSVIALVSILLYATERRDTGDQHPELADVTRSLEIERPVRSDNLSDSLVPEEEPIKRGARPRLAVENDRILVIEYPPWKANTWRYRLPEFVISTQTNEGRLRPDPFDVRQDGSIVLSGSLYEGEKGLIFASYRIVASVEQDGVSLEATITNGDLEPWNRGAYSTLCFKNNSAPQFTDSEGNRTYIMVGGTFLPINHTAHGLSRSGSAPLHRAHLLRKEDSAWLREYVLRYFAGSEIVSSSLIARSERDGRRHVGVAWDDSRHVSYNLDRRLNCIHSEPLVGALGHNESRTIRGKVYFIEGSLDEMYQRFKRDFPNLGYGGIETERSESRGR